MFWFDVKNKEDTGEIYIYGDITSAKWIEEDVTPTWFKDQINKLKGMKYINLFINSAGGGVFAGMAIYNILKRQTAKITARIDGIAASISSVIAMAADEIIMPKNALIMMHNPYSIMIGDANDMRKEADLLDKVKSIIVGAYKDKSQLSDEKIITMMDEETWLTGEEALKIGFADTLEKNKEVSASIKNNKYIINGMEIDPEKYKLFPKDKFKPVDIAGKEKAERLIIANQKYLSLKMMEVSK